MAEYTEDVAEKIDRQNLFRMPLRKAIVLFSVLFFVVIAFSSSFAYYFVMRRVLSENSMKELKQTMNTRRTIISAQLEKEILLTKIFASSTPAKHYFLDPSNEHCKREYFIMLNEHKEFFQNKMISWISLKDSNYYVNEQFMEKYSSSNPKHSWFFETLKYENPPLIKVDFDYLTRQIYDLYINYPIYYENKAIGTVGSRFSLTEFMNELDLPENVYLFGKDGVVIGAANEKIAKEKKTIMELFGSVGEEVYEKSLSLGKDSSEILYYGKNHYSINSVGSVNLYLVSKNEVNIKTIIHEKASIVFFALLLLMALAFVIFNMFISYILKPMNKNMQSYIEDSLLDELTKIPNKRFFNMRIEDEWNRATRGQYPISFLMLDLDKFKNYNDAYGHLEGDILLRESAQIFSNCLSRASDFVARFGGEEFCIVLANTKIEGARKVAEDVRRSMEKTGKITVSIGLVCEVPKIGSDYKNFIESADQKLYEAKNSGRNKVVG
ncbi:MAG: GGDEF domain-containing protein [Fibromonadaceae bacterium]|nr:GGDEF domain-containing protein [Fibromonadaceae bacterium]